MTTRMLIDARHSEETRVAVLKGNRIEEFDFESAEHKQIKGNIYLAKVTRVEPSLQAAFVDFGGNRHGFLAFSEIHPDYYQIPKEDRDALLAEEAAHAAEEEALRAYEDEDGAYDADDLDGVTEIDTSEKDQVATIEAGLVEDDTDGDDAAEDADDDYAAPMDAEAEAEDDDEAAPRRGNRRRQGRGRSKEAEELRAKRMALRRRYKIQDVIHRRQVLLVQVVKEERGNKGAALTTYLSLAGRYCVLMPNSSHGGGISRKISSAADRKRLKSIIGELNLPRSMGCIVRTAGLQRTKNEIKRDFDYLARLWDEIRENTLGSSAPALIHSDSDLVKRAIRDIYNREIEEVVVEGEDGYRAARAFMKLLMPSHGKRVKAYSDPVPLFQRYGAEDQLTAMYDPVVQLKSGGYIVINPTEALVSIDINSGRSTKEYGIEATAANTNLEAAREIARQLRLRDMAGLVVIDFIDMEHGGNVRKVEKAMKEALKDDRARIQVGRISGFGLMEMSRQRLRTGVLEATTRTCPHCDGSGLVRTASSAGLSALRLIEDEAAKGQGSVISLYASTEAAVYLLNTKRADLAEIESRYGVTVEAIPEGENEGAKMRVGSSGPRPTVQPRFEPIVLEEDDDDEVFEDEDEIESVESGRERSDGDDAGTRKRRKRRRGRGGATREDGAEAQAPEVALDDDGADSAETTPAHADGTADDDGGEAPRKRRRRGRRRRGGRGRDGESAFDTAADGAADDDAQPDAGIDGVSGDQPEDAVEPFSAYPAADVTLPEVAVPDASLPEDVPVVDEAATTDPEPALTLDPPAPPKRARRKKADTEAAPAVAQAEDVPAAKPARTRRKPAAPAGPEADAVAAAAVAEPESAPAPARPRRASRSKAAAAEPASEPAPLLDALPPAIEPALEEPAGDPLVAADGAGETEPAASQTAEPVAADPSDAAPARRGWWQRTFGN